MKWKSWLWSLGWPAPTKCYGYRLESCVTERLGRVQYAKWEHPRDYFQPIDDALLDQLATFIEPGDTVLDIGAHSGDMSLPLALVAGPHGAVFAWEPNPYVFPVLEANARLNAKLANLVPIPMAAAAADGLITLNYSDPGFCNGGTFEGVSRWRHGHPFSLELPSMDVSGWLRREHPERLSRLSLVKVDAEGADLTILQALDSLVCEFEPVIHVEVHRHLSLARRHALLHHLQQRGYDCRLAAGPHAWTAGERVTVDRANDWSHYDVIAIPDRNSQHHDCLLAAADASQEALSR
jgi:FkbM family methyltransferase